MKSALPALLLLVWLPAAAGAAPYGTETPPPPSTQGRENVDIGRQAQTRRAFVEINEGFALYQRSDMAGAEAKFRAAIARDPDEPQGSTAYYDLGLVLARTGRYDDAGRAFDTALTRDPGIVPAWLGLVYVDLQRRRYADAQRDARAMRASAPSSALARFQEGYAALLDGQYELASNAFASLLPGNANVASLRYNLGLALLHAGRLDDARVEAQHAVALAPAFAKGYFLLGSIALRAGDRTAAARAYAKARQVANDPSMRLLCDDVLRQLRAR
ncbi:MAG: tetratricopeptide repeat protein [bacterium]|nr:tetratricopeptide repeat protein [bacterium]